MAESICIVAPRYLSSTPRVVKEADALHHAGFDVRVVHALGGMEVKRKHDHQLLRNRDWEASHVGWDRGRNGEWRMYWMATLRQRAGRLVPRWAWDYLPVAETQSHRVYPEVARLAAADPADLYIGHYPAGLAAAAFAARTHDALLGYDAEDYHVGQMPEEHRRNERIDYIERRYLKECNHLTAASDGIARALAERYGVERPTVVHNVFPWAERGGIDEERKDRKGDSLSLYWYSQTVGLDRGLQDAIRAAGRVDDPVQIHIRGALSEHVGRKLRTVARTSGVEDRLYFHPQVPPDDLLSRTAEHDVGLALEQGHTPNRSLCVTNKLFHYPLAGLAIAATDVEGQRQVLEDQDTFYGLYEPGDAEGLARILQRWTDPEELEAAKTSALETARSVWNWETERQKIIRAVKATLSK